MKTEQILSIIKEWAKNGGHKIRAAIKEEPPKWISTEKKENSIKAPKNSKLKSRGVLVSVYQSNDTDANSWDYWFVESGAPVFCNCGFQYPEELEGFKSAPDIRKLLNESVSDCYELWGLDIFRAWAEKSAYYVHDNPDMGYMHYDDEFYGEAPFLSGVILFGLDSIKIYKTVSLGVRESAYNNPIIMPPRWHKMPHYENTIIQPLERLHAYSQRIKHYKELIAWLDENANIGFLSDRCIKHLDKKTLQQVLKNRQLYPGSRDFYFFELESATDDAIELLCNYSDVKVVYLSEKALNSLKETQLEKLIQSSIIRNEQKDSLSNQALLDLNFDIGVINRKSLDETTAWKIVRYAYLPVDLRPTGSTLRFDLTEIGNVSDECCEILSYCDLDRSCWPLKWSETLKRRVLKKESERRNGEMIDLQKANNSEVEKLLKKYKSSIKELINKLGDFHPETLIQLTILCELQIIAGDLKSASRTSECFVDALKKHKDSSLREWLDLPNAEKRHENLLKENHKS